MKQTLFFALLFISITNASPDNQPTEQTTFAELAWNACGGKAITNFLISHGEGEAAKKQCDKLQKENEVEKENSKTKDAQIKDQNEKLTELATKSNETCNNINITQIKLIKKQQDILVVNQKIAQSTEQIAQSSQETAQSTEETTGSLKKYVDYMTSKETLDTTHKVIAIASDGANVAEKTYQFGRWAYRQFYPKAPTEEEIKHKKECLADIKRMDVIEAFNECLGEHQYEHLGDNGFPKSCKEQSTAFLKAFGTALFNQEKASFDIAKQKHSCE